MSGIAGVLLAAGESRRMGARNKLALPVNGKPLLRRTAETLLGSSLTKLVVVLGHERPMVSTLLTGLAVDTVYNPRYREGQMTSVHAGLATLEDSYGGVMIALADQPLLESADVDLLIDAFQRDRERSILVPVHRGRRGNPVILANRHIKTVLEGGQKLGCRRFIDNNPELVNRLEVGSEHFVVDLDTAEDYAALGNCRSQRVSSASPTGAKQSHRSDL